MLYAVEEREGAALLSGEYGSGKTLLSRVLLSQLSRQRYKTALIINPILPPLELIGEIIYQLSGNLPSLVSKSGLLHCLNEILYTNINKNENTVIIIDEAQALPQESFEELRLLLNLQLYDDFLFTLILLGQPELRTKINSLPQLKQRLVVRYHLSSLSQQQTREYVRHRLKVAGREEEIFQADALSEIYRFAAGIPRRINNLCDMALLVACGQGRNKIGKETIFEVAQDLEEVPINRSDQGGLITNGYDVRYLKKD